MAGTGKGNGRSRSLRDDKQKDKQRQNSKGWETMWWRSGFLRSDAHKNVSISGRNDGIGWGGREQATATAKAKCGDSSLRSE
jgi:hypothetical protein